MATKLTLVHSRESVPENFTQPFLTQEQINCLQELDDTFLSGCESLFNDERIRNIIYTLPPVRNMSETLVVETKEDIKDIVTPTGEIKTMNAAQMNVAFQELIMSELKLYLVPSKEYEGFREISLLMEPFDIRVFLSSGILTDENLQTLLNAIIDSYLIPAKYVLGGLNNLDDLTNIIPWVSDTSRLSSLEIRMGIMELMKDEYELEQIMGSRIAWESCDNGFQNILNEFKDIGVVLLDSNIDEMLILFYNGCIKEYGEESENNHDYMPFFNGYEARLRELQAQGK